MIGPAPPAGQSSRAALLPARSIVCRSLRFKGGEVAAPLQPPQQCQAGQGSQRAQGKKYHPAGGIGDEAGHRGQHRAAHRGQGGEQRELGRGVQRVELEEATTEPIFSALWALTEGQRVVKRRYEVRDGDLLWQVDAFDDRELFLVEVELESPHQVPTLPDWLSPFVVREVTHEREYVNLFLAR